MSTKYLMTDRSRSRYRPKFEETEIPKPPHTSVFLDLETLSRAPHAVIAEIGVVVVDATEKTVLYSASIKPCMLTQMLDGRHVCHETLNWHREQGTLPDPAEYGGDMAECMDIACDMVEQVFVRHSPRRVWIQGPDFDLPILKTLFGAQGRELPWKYWQTRDARTVWELAFPGRKRAKRPHLAVEDATATFHDTLEALTALGLEAEL